MKKYFRFTAIAVMAIMSFGVVSCGDDDDNEIDSSPISFYVGDEKVIEGADTIASANKFVAFGKGNTVTGYHVGKTTLKVNGKTTIPVTVNAMYHLYDDPISNWGCSVNYVRSNQKQGTINSNSTNEMLMYDDAGGASVLAYNFENGKLKSVLAMVSTNHASTLVDYLLERFIMAPYYKGSETYYVGLDGLDDENTNTAVLMQVYSASYISVFYTSAKTTASSRSDVSHQALQDKMAEMAKQIGIE